MAQEAQQHAATPSLLGAWESNEAFGNTTLDWSQAVKDQRVTLQLTFEPGGVFTFRLVSKDTATDVTSSFRHVVASEGSYERQGQDGIVIHGDASGIKWTFLFEEEDSLRIRLEGAKRFGRCKGVDVIYFARVKTTQQLKDL
ncbi:Chitin synthase, class 2 [Phytophthora pseudosyringae]|uniref:Chitin synthase, class 2 n=1 Tax=Phytophthora pseudosyringae TaxID=221518 RepID=A0A8T1VT99_9STRA|nr:Chitin synthase, class 2 [Phytophthora pseudosyringae]